MNFFEAQARARRSSGRLVLLLLAMTCCVEHDGRIDPLEVELLSAIAWVLGCLLPDQSRHAGLASDGLAGQDGS